MNRLAIVLSLLLSPSVHAAEAAGEFVAYGAQKRMDEDWAPARTQTEVGGEISIGEKGKPVGFTFGALTSTGNGETSQGRRVTVRTTEGYGGIRFLGRGAPIITPYFEIGGAMIQAAVNGDGFPDGAREASGVGWYGAGGLMFRGESSPLVVGAKLRYSSASVEFTGTSDPLDAGGLHAGLTLGVAWPVSKPARVVKVGAAVEEPTIEKAPQSMERVILKTAGGSFGITHGDRVLVVRADGESFRGKVVAVDADGLTLKGLLAKPRAFTAAEIADIKSP